MTPIKALSHSWPSMPNLTSAEENNPLFHTPGLRKNPDAHSTLQLSNQSPPDFYKPEAIFYNQKGVAFSKELQSLLTKYLLTSFKGQRLAPGNIPREIHGVMHGIRTALWIPVILSCYEEKLTERELEALMITACLHDSGRDGDYADRPEWEYISSRNCKKELRALGYESTTIEKCINAILHKDSSKSIFAKVLHDADCLEVIRVRKAFNISRLHIYQMITDNNISCCRVNDIVIMIRNVISGQGDLKYGFEPGICHPDNLPKNYDNSTKSKFEFSENALATQLLWLSQNQNSLYKKIIDKCEFLAIDQSFQIHSERNSWQHRGVKTLSPILRLHTDEPGTTKRTGVFTSNTNLNDLMSLSADFMLDRLSHISSNELPNFLDTLIDTSPPECSPEIMKLNLLSYRITASVGKLKALFESSDSNIDKMLVFMDLTETYFKIDKFFWPTKHKHWTPAYDFYMPIVFPLDQFCTIAEQAVDQGGVPYKCKLYTSYSTDTRLKRSYLCQDSPTTIGNHERVVDVDRLDQPPFTLNRNMNSRYGFHQFGIRNVYIEEEDVEQKNKSLKESVTVHPLAELSSDQWDGKIYHGTQSTNFCDPSVKVIGSNPCWSRPYSVCRPIGFYTDLDPLGAPIIFSTKVESDPSFIVELNGTAAKKWTCCIKEEEPGWIVFEGEEPEGIHVNKVYRLSPRIRMCIDIFKKI